MSARVCVPSLTTQVSVCFSENRCYPGRRRLTAAGSALHHPRSRRRFGEGPARLRSGRRAGFSFLRRRQTGRCFRSDGGALTDRRWLSAGRSLSSSGGAVSNWGTAALHNRCVAGLILCPPTRGARPRHAGMRAESGGRARAAAGHAEVGQAPTRPGAQTPLVPGGRLLTQSGSCDHVHVM